MRSWNPDWLQTSILEPHSFDHARYLFFQMSWEETAEALAWAKVRLPGVITRQSSPVSDTILTASISGRFHRSIHESNGILRDLSFLRGMQNHRVYSRLSDPIPEDYWEPFWLEPCDLMISISGTTLAQVTETEQNIRASIKGFTFLFSETGKRLYRTFDGVRKKVEHFGYADGISNPETAEDLLVDEGNGAAGSYLVFRKLEQNVALFRSSITSLAKELNHPDPEEFAKAQLIGRFQDGTPLTLASNAGEADSSLEFDFEEDQDGRKCPRHAHLRKVNPRYCPAGQGGTFIGRRSMNYDSIGRPTDLSDAPKGGVGMLFQCYQKSIVDQFEHIQANWASNRRFPRDGDRADRIVGQRFGRVSENPWNKSWGVSGEESIPFDMGNIVWLKGGEYFYTPSIRYFEALPDWPVGQLPRIPPIKE